MNRIVFFQNKTPPIYNTFLKFRLAVVVVFPIIFFIPLFRNEEILVFGFAVHWFNQCKFLSHFSKAMVMLSIKQSMY